MEATPTTESGHGAQRRKYKRDDPANLVLHKPTHRPQKTDN